MESGQLRKGRSKLAIDAAENEADLVSIADIAEV
jgi:hypothetical protein